MYCKILNKEMNLKLGRNGLLVGRKLMQVLLTQLVLTHITY